MMKPLYGTGLGLRREMLDDLKSQADLAVDFFEIAPENWLNLGGQYHADLSYFTERYAFCCHGLSLSLGGTEALDMDFLSQFKGFIKTHNIQLYTEHLSWCTDDGHLYDLLPIPTTYEAVRWVAQRIQQVQDFLGMQIGVENASYYITPPGGEMSEQEFINAVIEESGCFLHLDVNNIYVNSQNHNFDALSYLQALPLDKVGYIHVAGHYREPDGLIIDTHGAEVIDPVWELLEQAYALLPDAQIATCLERDFNYPGLEPLMQEVRHIRTLQQAAVSRAGHHHVIAQGA